MDKNIPRKKEKKKYILTKVNFTIKLTFNFKTCFYIEDAINYILEETFAAITDIIKGGSKNRVI